MYLKTVSQSQSKKVLRYWKAAYLFKEPVNKKHFGESSLRHFLHHKYQGCTAAIASQQYPLGIQETIPWWLEDKQQFSSTTQTHLIAIQAWDAWFKW